MRSIKCYCSGASVALLLLQVLQFYFCQVRKKEKLLLTIKAIVGKQLFWELSAKIHLPLSVKLRTELFGHKGFQAKRRASPGGWARPVVSVDIIIRRNTSARFHCLLRSVYSCFGHECFVSGPHVISTTCQALDR